MSTHAITTYITSLSREEAMYAAAYAHWLPSGQLLAEANAENRRKPVTKARAAAIRRRILELNDTNATKCSCKPDCQRWLPCDCACHEPEIGEA